MEIDFSSAFQILILFIFFILCMTILYTLPLLGEQFERKLRRQRLKNKINSAYQTCKPTWDHLLLLAEEALLHNALYKSQIKLTIKSIITDVLTGVEEYSEEKILYLDSMISHIEKDEPFEGIPDNLVIHLQKIRDQLGGNPSDLAPLVEQLQELSTDRKKEKRQLKSISWLSLIITTLSLAFAIYAYL